MALSTDLRHAARLLARSPIFTATAVASIAIGIAATSTVYSLVDALLVAPSPGLRHPATLVDVGRANAGRWFDNMTHPAFAHLRDHTRTLSGLAAVEFGGGPMSLGVDGSSERVFSMLVSASYFEVLGTRPAIGRFFLPQEDEVAGRDAVVVLSHAFWTRRLGADPAVLERPLQLNGRDFTVVGVAEAGFVGSSLVGTDLWVPIAMQAVARGRATDDLRSNPRATWHVAVGRLRPGATLAEAAAELNALHEAFKAGEPRANPRHTIAVATSSRIPGPVRGPVLGFLGLLFTLTGGLLAIACANLTGLLLARAEVRRREIATRLALGASRGRLAAQLLTETLLLFAAACAVALPVTIAAVQVLVSLLPALPVPVTLAPTVTLRVVAFAIAVSGGCALFAGVSPLRYALRTSVGAALRGGHAAGGPRLWLRHALVAAQTALSLMLVATALLFARSLQHAARTDPGFRTADVLLASVDVSLSGHRGQDAATLVARLEESLATLSGVEAVAAARIIPLQGGGLSLGRVRVPGYAGPGGDDTIDADWNVVSPSFFATLAMPLAGGRGFLPGDRDGAPLVAVVNETLAREAWPGQPAIGQRFLQQRGEEQPRPVEVVGVVADAKYRYLSDDRRPFVFVPLAQQPMADMTFFVRHAPGRQPAADVRAALARVDRSVPLLFVQSFDEAAALGLLPQRLAAGVAAAVGVVGLALAALGLYGLMAFMVAQRTREFAIRVALGASAGRIRALVLGRAAAIAIAGSVAGVGLAAAVAGLARNLLVGVAPVDPWSLGLTALALAAVLGLACRGPLQAATRTDAAAALRAE